MSYLSNHLGELAALGAAMCWVFTALAFAAAGRRIGATAVNVIRIFLALIALIVINRLLFGQWLPPVERSNLVLLAVSGVIGLAIGDQLLFTAFVNVGPRLSLLLMTVTPPVTALLAWPVLDEALAPRQWTGIAVTMAGIAWVVLERREQPGSAGRAVAPHRVRGLMGAGAAGVCQAAGLILSKLGMGHGPGGTASHVDPWTATMYRMAFAGAAVIVLVAILRRRAASRAAKVGVSAPRDRRLPLALALVGVGVIFGPVLGVWNSMVAVDRIDTGVAATLMALSPVFVLPLAVWIEKERISPRAALGAIVAVAGVALLAASG